MRARECPSLPLARSAGSILLQKFPACIMRITDPKTTALIFRTGKMIVTGAKVWGMGGGRP